MKHNFTLLMTALMLLITNAFTAFGQTQYEKVTSAPTDWSGEYLLVYEESETSAYVWTGVDAVNCYTTSSISQNVISAEQSVTITIATMEGGYSVKINGGDNNGKYISHSANSNGLTTGDNAVAQVVTYSDNSVLMTNGGGAVMRFNSTSNQMRFRFYKSSSYSSQQPVQLYKKVESGNAVATPTFSPAAGTYAEAQNVTINCETEGATIFYTTDGTTPDTLSTVYSTPISISETTTVKAIAMKAGLNNSSVATATYTIEAPLTTMDEIFAKATAAGSTATNVTITFNNWVVTGVAGSNAYLTDGTKGLIIYGSGHGFTVGDHLTGTASCKVQLYQGSSELTNLKTTTTGLTVTPGSTVEPVVMTIDQITSGVYTGAVITINNVSYDGTDAVLSDGTNTIKPYNKLYSGMSFTDGENYNVTGLYLQYNAIKQIMPRNAEDIELIQSPGAQVATPTFSPEAGVYAEAQNVTISCETEGATIYYTLDGTDPTTESTVYTEPISISATTTVKAIAMKEGFDNSEVAEAEYTIEVLQNGDFGRVSKASDITTDGTYLLVCVSAGTAATSSVSSSALQTSSVTITDNSITTGYNIDGKPYAVTIETATDGYYIKLNNGRYINNTTGTGIAASVTASSVWAFNSYEGGMIAQNTSNSNRFLGGASAEGATYKAYAVSNLGGEANPVVMLFKKDLTPSVESVATPTFSPEAGTYTEAQTVTISCETEGATIFYTTDGTTPDSLSTVYSTPISISETTTVKAMAMKEGLDNSEVAEAEYVINTTPVTDGFNRLLSHNDLARISETTEVMIVDVTGSKALTSANGTTSAPTAVAVTINDNVISGDVDDALLWNVHKVTDGYIFTVKGDNTKWLYSTDANNGVRVGTNEANIWTVDIVNGNYHGMVHNGTTRYLGVYNDQNWRAYTSVNDNIKNTQIEFFINGELPEQTQVATPTFTPGEGSYFEAQSVSISCTTDGATIHYTTDGTTPTTSSDVYGAPIAVNTTTTIKAFAVKASMENSAVATATYTFPSVMTIAAARALENNEYALVEGVVTFIDSRNIYIQDETAGIDLYLNNNTVPETLALGDKVKAYGKKTVFNGLIELTGIDGSEESQFNIVSNGNELPLAVKTIAEINTDGLTSLQSTRVKVENATIGTINTSGNTTLTQGENTINIYKIPELTGISEGDGVNVIAVVGCYNAIQLRVALATDVEKVGETQTVATPTFTPEEGTYSETQNVSIACETEGATIRYTLDGTDPTETSTEYTSALTISETTTVKAIAYKSGLNPSDIASATYTITPPAQETAYTLITGSNGLVAGDKYIVVGIKSDSYYALGKQNTNNRVSVAVTPEGNVITTTPATTSADETVYELTLGQDSVGYWTLYDAVNGGYLYAASSSSNYLKNQATNDANGVWTIDIAPNGVATIKAQGSNTRNWLRLNNNGSPFSCYGSGQLDVYLYKAGEIPPATIVATPTFTPGEGSYTEAQNVTISCTTDGATIHYTTDGTEPTVESIVYTEPIAVSTTTTIKAFAVKAGMDNSVVATATYTFPSVITIAAALALENNEYALVEGIVTFIDGRNIYIQDTTAGIDLYLNNNTVPDTLALGDKVMAYGKKTAYNGLVELTGIDGGDASQFSIVSNGNELPLAVKTIAEINADFAGSNMLQSTRVKIANGKIGAINTSGNTPMYQGENTINLYKMPVVEGLLENDSVTVIGIVGCFNAPQIRINSASDVEFTHPAGPSIAANPTQLTGFNYTFEEGPSAIQSFEVSGSNLTASATITASENFEISTTDGASFNAQSTITINETSFSNVSIYVRLKAGLEIGEYNETLVFASEGAETVNIAVSGSVAEPQVPSSYARISSVSQLADGMKVIIAARYNTTGNEYYAMTAATTGKPEGVSFTSVDGESETLPSTIADEEATYYWTVGINNGNYTFTNANGDVLGYTSGTNFSTDGDNTAWSIEYSTSDAAAMVPSYSAFVITNVNNNGRAIALNTSHNFGPYAKSNMTGSNAANYNFFLDIFATEGGTPVCATPTITPASGTYYEAQSVTISCATEGATIYYTTDGSAPTAESAVYSSPIEVSENMTIKAFASKEGYDDSGIATAEYTIILGATTIFAQDWEGEMNDWTFVTVEGSKPWTVASNSGNHYAYANGYNGGANEQWCISPAFNLDNYSDVTLSFRNAKNYDGDDMQLYISNDYDGSNAATATWNELTYTMSTGSWAWVESGTISLDSYSGTNCHIGYKYTCTETEAAGWEVDDIIMVGFTSNPSLTATPTALSGFGYMEGHGPSSEQSFVVNGVNLTSDVTISMTGTNFEMSATSGDAFAAQPTITLTPAAGAVNQTVYVRMTEGLAANTYVGTITVTSQLDDIDVSLAGSVMEEGDNWNRIFSVNDLENGAKVIVAARYNNVENEYFAMTATTSGKPEGVLFTSVTEGVLEILPDEIALDESTYSWTVSIENGNLTFTNAAGDVLGYGGSGTNFQTNGDNTNWNIDYVLSDPESMVPEYWGFLINNVNYTSRAFAINSNYHSFGPYSTQNMTGANASGYNFCVDIFVQGGEVTPTVMTPTFSMASGTYYEEIDVEISTSTTGATIHYTTDGTEPTAASAVYTDAIHVANDMTIKAIAMKEGYDNSGVATAEYVIMSDIVVVFSQDWENGMNGWTFETFEGNKPWVIATYNNNQYANANGYGDDVDNEQWCISPAFNLNALAGQNPTLTFMNATKFEGPAVELLFTNDYDGQDPTAATWQPLTFNQSSGNYEWVSSGEISLSQFSGSICNIAFKYTSTPEAAASWEIDDIMLYATPSTDPFIIPSSYSMTGFDYVYDLGPSATQSFTLTAGNLEGDGVVTVTSSEYFKLTLDEETWLNEISLEYTDGQLVGQPVTVYVRMKCSLEIGTYDGDITIDGGGASCQITLEGEVTPGSDVTENIEENVNIFQNGNDIIIKNDSDNVMSMTMFNILGQPVMSETVTAGDNRIEHNLTTGAYIIRISDGSKVMSRKIVLR